MMNVVSTWQLNIIFLKEGESIVALLLEHDIAGQGKTRDEAKSNLLKTLAGQILLDASHGKTPLSLIPPAPAAYHRAYAANLDDAA